jgi:hypothetical protein
MTGDRPYRAGVPADVALEELRQNVGTQFDGRCFSALVRAIDENAVDLGARARRGNLSLVTDLRPAQHVTQNAAKAWVALVSEAGGPAPSVEQPMPSQGAARLKS